MPDSTPTRSMSSTPPRSTKPTVWETPSIVRHTASASYRSGDLEKARSAVVNDLGHWIPEVSIDFMLDHILPQVQCNIRAVKDYLTREGHLTGQRWKCFPEDPVKTKTVENTTFRPLQDVFHQISSSAMESRALDDFDGGGEDEDQDIGEEGASMDGSQGIDEDGGKNVQDDDKGAVAGSSPPPTFIFVNNPHHAPYSERTNESRPDGFSVRKETRPRPIRNSTTKSTTSPHRWDDIAVPAEYKKHSRPDDVDDNTRKILWSLHHIMRSDPCRRFAFGITIEDTATRIWFCCRSAVFVSQSFNFILDHEILIRFVISFSFADEVRLGWDPTMERVITEDQCVQYKITVHERKPTDAKGENENEAECEIVPTVYLATKILFDSSADTLRGRGTRVFEARRFNDSCEEVGEAVAIKDVWVDHDRDREGTIRHKLHKEASDEDKALIEKYFLTVLNHGDVMIGTTADNTRDVIMRNQDVPMANRFVLPKRMTDRRPNYVTSSGVPTCWDEFSQTRAPPVEHHQFSPKVHYRIIFKEVGTPIYKVTALKDAFHVLIDAIAGLQVLHKYHYVHRDISSGNVLVCDGNGKLGDLEYTKNWHAESSHEIRTGTLDFMSIEVESQDYEFRKKTSLDVTKRIIRKPRIPAPPFRYNPLHDLESTWWLAVWFIFCHREKGTHSDADMRNAKDQLKHVQELFPRSIKYHGRFKKFAKDGYYEDGISSLPESFHEAAGTLEEARALLVACYEQAEDGAEINPAAFKGVHELLKEIFSEGKDASREVELQSLVSVLIPPRATVKRGREGEASTIRKEGASSKRKKCGI